MNERLTHASALCWVLAAVVVGCASCTNPPPGAFDGGVPRDGTIADATLTNDGAADAGTSSDASAEVDGGAPACGGGCDPRASVGCGQDMSCRFVSGIPACMPQAPSDAGAGAEGAHCAYDADCGAGLACFDTAGGATCGRVCCASRMDCPSTQRCRGDGRLVDGTTSAWGRCLLPVSCDLGHPERACVTREGCYIVDGMGTTECLIAGAAATGAACTGVADCAPGHVCTGLTTRTCVAICLLPSTAPHQGCMDTEHCEAQAYSPAGTGICTAS